MTAVFKISAGACAPASGRTEIHHPTKREHQLDCATAGGDSEAQGENEEPRRMTVKRQERRRTRTHL